MWAACWITSGWLRADSIYRWPIRWVQYEEWNYFPDPDFPDLGRVEYRMP